jgi:hypothetical protein
VRWWGPQAIEATQYRFGGSRKKWGKKILLEFEVYMMQCYTGSRFTNKHF